MAAKRPLRSFLAPSLALGALSGTALCGGGILGDFRGGTSGWTQRVSYAGDGTELLEDAEYPSLSGDGRWVAFVSAEALLPEDDNGLDDVYVRDRRTSTLILASKNYWGGVGNGASTRPSISGDGRRVAFQSQADNFNLVDTNGQSDIYVKDLDTGVVRLASRGWETFDSGLGNSIGASLSASGSHVAFQSAAANLLPGDTNGVYDIYVMEVETGTMRRASIGWNGEPSEHCRAPSISAYGRRVAFHSAAPDLVFIDGNGTFDVFVHDFDDGQTRLVSRAMSGWPSSGASYWPSISADGEFVAYTSTATDMAPEDDNPEVDVFVTDIDAGISQLVSISPSSESGWGPSDSASLSANGRYVAFASNAMNLVEDWPGNRQIYLRDLDVGQTWLMSRPAGALELPDHMAKTPSLATDGSAVAFLSQATNLVPGDTNDAEDVFVRTPIADPRAYCESALTSAGCLPSIGSSGYPSVASDSGFVIHVESVPPNKAGLLFYGLDGRKSLPFMGGTLCVEPPHLRSILLWSTPTGAGACGGSVNLDMNAFASGALGGHPNPRLQVPGQRVNAQYWGRDPGDAQYGSYLSDAIEFTVGP